MRLRSRRHEPAVHASVVVEQVEPRLLFSADLAGALMLGTGAADAGAEQRTLDSDGEYAAAAATSSTAAAESTASPPAAADPASVATNYAAIGLAFEQNQGQAGEGADYTAYGSGYSIALQDGNAALNLLTAQGQATVTLQLGGDTRAAQAEGQGLLETRSNYLIGNDSSAWRTGIANYGSVLYRGVYEGIDVRYYGNQRQLEYDFIVAAGADASAISLRFGGIESASIGPDGELVLRVAGSDGEVRFRAPVSFQRGEYGLEAVASRYEIRADGSIGFVIGSYDTSRELVIDPVLDYATYFGSAGDENAPAIAVDAAGNVYVTGRTTGSGSPFGGLSGPGGGAGDIYVAKLSADLSTVLFSTRLGGSDDEQAKAIAVDAAGNIAVTGWTRSGNFPLQSAADGSRDGVQDAIIFKLNSSGGLVFSTYFGGGGGDTDSGNAVAMDSSGNVYAAGQGRTDPALLPLLLQILFGSSDNAFVNKYNASGGVVYQELFGGSSLDAATGIALGASNDVFVVGATSSGDWNASGPDGSLGGSRDGFLLHLDAAGNETYSTYIGGANDDFATGVATDGGGKAFVVGVTRGGTGFTTTAGAFQAASAAAGQDTGFLRVYDLTRPAASSLVYSSFLGGSGVDRPTGVAHVNGRVVIVGEAGSTDFPVTADALQPTGGGSPLYLVVLDPRGNGAADLHFGTYYASGLTSVGGVAVSGNRVYVSGQITADGWASTGAYQAHPQASDAFVAAFTLPNTAPVLNGLVQPPAIAEDVVGDPGFLVSSLLAGQVVDNDLGALQGVVVIGADNTNGTWEYTTDGGSSWNAVVSTSVTSGLLLAADAQTRLRFVPNANYNGTVTAGLTVRAWDRTLGVAGGRADTTATGGTTAFSASSRGVNVTVTPVNDAPVGVADTLAATEDTPATYTAAQLLGNDSDVEGSPLTLIGVASGTGGTATLNADGTVTFTPAADFNGDASFSYTVSDGAATTTVSVRVVVAAVDDAPVGNADSVVANRDAPATYSAAALLGNDTDVDSATLWIASVANGSNGTVQLNADGSVTFTPAAGHAGPATFTYTVTDGTTASAQITVNVLVNSPPQPVDDVLAATEDTPVTFTAAQLLGNDVDPEGDPLTITGVTSGAGGTATLNADGTVTFTPDADFNGTATFTYEVSDGRGTSSSAAVSIDVVAVNDAPVAVDQAFTTAEDSWIDIPISALLAGASDVEGSPLALDGVTAVGGATVAVVGGAVRFTPAADFTGTATFTFTLTDGLAVSAPATVSVTVTPVNDAPTNAPVSLADLAEDSGSVVLTATELLGNAADVDGDALSVVNLVADSGSLADNGDGTWTFTPAGDFNGTVRFTYEVDDGTTRVSGAATLVVTSVNDAPTNAPVFLAGIAEDSGSLVLTAAQLLGNANDVDGDTLSVVNLVADSGSLTDNGDGTWTFTPALDFNGTVRFTYKVDDGTARVAGTATLVVTPVNDAPTNAPVSLADIAEDSGSIVLTAVQLLGNANDVDGDTLSVANLVADSGSLTDNADGTWTFTPDRDFNGTVGFSYEVDDGTTRVSGTARLVVTPVNDAPTNAPVSLADIAEDSGSVPLTAAQLLGNANDVDGDTLSVVNLAADSGSLTDNGDGTWTFTPALDFNGTVRFTYKVDDGTARVAGTATLVVTPVNDAPTNAPVPLADIAEDSGSIVLTAAQLLGNANDVDGDTLSVANLAADSGSLTDNGDGTWTFTPAVDFNGTVRFTYEVDDGTTRAAGTATLVVTPVNDAPTNAPVSLADIAEDSGSIVLTAAQLLGNANDVDGDTLSVANLVADSGSLTDNADGTWTFTPDRDFNGTVGFSYEVDDGTTRVSGTARLVVTPVNDAPVAVADTLAATEDTPATYAAADLLGNDTDVDGDALSIAGVGGATHGTVRLNADGSVTFTADTDYHGAASFTYTVTDGSIVSGPVTVTVNVGSVNDAPTNSAVSLPDLAEDSGGIVLTAAQLLGNAADVDGDPLSVVNLVADSGSLADSGDGTWTFTPTRDFNGTVRFTYEVNDGTTRVAGTATLAVTPVNDAPSNTPLALADIAEDSGSIVLTAAQLLANAADADGDALSIANLAADSGSLAANADGTWTFTPARDFNGTVRFTYQVDDGTTRVGGSATLAVTPVNDAPVAAADTLDATEDTPVTFAAADLLGNDADADGDGLSIAGVVGATHGTVRLNADGTVTFTADANFHGVASFIYTVTDGAAISGPVTVTVNVAAVNDAPTNAPVVLPGMAEDAGGIVVTAAQLLGNAADVDGDTLSVVNLMADSGSLVANADGTWTFTPGRDYNGTVRFSYDVDDGTTRVAGTATLAVAPVNDAPRITTPQAEPVARIDSPEHQALVVAVSASDVDTPSSQLVFSIVGGADAGVFVIDPATGELRFAAAPDFSSPRDADGDNVYEVVVQVSDASLIDTQRLAIRVVSSLPPVQEPVRPTPSEPPPPAAPPATAAAQEQGPQRGPDLPALPTDRTSDSLLAGFGPAVETSISGFGGGQVSFAEQQAARLLLEAGTAPVLRTVVLDREGLDLLSSMGGLDMILARFGIQDRFESGAPLDVQRVLQSASFTRELDRLRDEVREELQLDKAVTISVASVSLGLSFAYVLWLIRSGVLLGSYLSAMPAWRLLDPLPVLPRVEEEDEEDDEPLAADRRGGRDVLRGF